MLLSSFIANMEDRPFPSIATFYYYYYASRAHKSLQGKQILPYLKNKALFDKSANCKLRKPDIISVETLLPKVQERETYPLSKHTNKVHVHATYTPST